MSDPSAVRSFADLVLEVTEPPDDPVFHELLLRMRPATHMALGLLKRLRGNLRGMCALVDAGEEHAGVALARAAIEYASTGAWLMRDPKRNYERLLMGYRDELARTVAVKPELKGMLDRVDDVLEHYFDHHRGERLPGVKKRMGPVDIAYYQFRILSEIVHPSFAAASLSFVGEDDDDDDKDETTLRDAAHEFERMAEDYLLTCCLWTCYLAQEFQKNIGFGPTGQLQAAQALLYREATGSYPWEMKPDNANE